MGVNWYRLFAFGVEGMPRLDTLEILSKLITADTKSASFVDENGFLVLADEELVTA